jgi:RNA polymerase sigma-70 factor (ECF subfamily)
MRTAMVLTGDRGAAESAVRSTWLLLPRRLDDYRPPPGLWCWACGLLLGELGLQVVAPEVAHGASPAATVDRSRFLPPTHPQWPGHWEVPPTVWPAIDDGPVAQGAWLALQGALDRLPSAQRVVVSLRDVAGCEIAEIAEIVRQPPEQVRALLNHGRAELRRRLELHFAEVQPA